MPLLEETFENVTASTAVTISNTSFDSIVVDGTGSITGTNASPIKGGISALVEPQAGELAYMLWSSSSVTNDTSGVFRVYVGYSSMPSEAQFLVRFRSAVDTSDRVAISVSSSGQVRIHDAAGSIQFTSGTGVLGNTVRRLECAITTPTNSTGTIDLKVYDGDATSPTVLDQQLSGQNFGSAGIGALRVGKATTGGSQSRAP
jgi:hypothetical protein